MRKTIFPVLAYLADKGPKGSFFSYNNLLKRKETGDEGLYESNYRLAYNEHGYPTTREQLNGEGKAYRIITFTYEEVE